MEVKWTEWSRKWSIVLNADRRWGWCVVSVFSCWLHKAWLKVCVIWFIQLINIFSCSFGEGFAGHLVSIFSKAEYWILLKMFWGKAICSYLCYHLIIISGLIFDHTEHPLNSQGIW
jgi:hypothetical protein